MTCKECIHYDACGGFLPTDLDRDVFDYCAKGIADEIPDIEERCSEFLSTSDVVEVIHGEWIKPQFLSRSGFFTIKEFHCNRCGETFEVAKGNELMHHCPKCGAKMDGERSGNGK